MNKRWIAKCAGACALVLMLGGAAACAEEKRLGDYIYVPAMQVSRVSGSISLRVEGLALDKDTDTPVKVESLPGAEFGVYVFSGSGELTPWANPLYPSEQMRIRTGEGETRFSLPQGAEFYLRQESAPQGYVFDDETLIPVTGGEIVVQNTMAGELVVSAVDTLGVPLAGVEICLTGEDGETVSAYTDENGEVTLDSASAQRFTVCEGALPEGVFAALHAGGGELTDDMVYADVAPAQRTRITFEHPASGAVQLNMRLSVLDDNAAALEYPLAGVCLEIASDPAVTLVTDEQGQARASLLEGTYDVALSYAGEQQALLPITQGQMIVSSGSTTVIELTAVQPAGRIVLLADQMVSGGSVVFVSEETGTHYGPYPLDAEGMAVSSALDAGAYRVAELNLPEGVQFGSMTCGESTADDPEAIILHVAAGQATHADLQLLTSESQRFALAGSWPDEQGSYAQSQIDDELILTLIDAYGQQAGQFSAGSGSVTVDALSGMYALCMTAEDAQRLGVQQVSAWFEIPSAQETVTFAAEQTRLMLACVGYDGEAAAGALYQLTDSTGERFEVACDGDGMAVTPMLAPGDVLIETLDAPEGYDAAPVMTVQAVSGETAGVQIVHERYGSAQFSVAIKRLDENGREVYAPLPDARLSLYHIAAEGAQPADMGVLLTSDEAGMAEISLAAGEYMVRVDEQTLPQGVRAAQDVRFSAENMRDQSVLLACADALGGVRVQLTGGEIPDDELAQIRFELTGGEDFSASLALKDGVFYAGGLPEGEYLLTQTQIPQGYTLAAQQQLYVSGGEVTDAAVPLEEYAVVSVSKTGLTFDQALRTYIVPLSGQYGVYTMEDGEMKPYPDAQNQVTLWANVTLQQMAEGKAGSAKLPAALEGTTYYLHELTGAAGFAADETYYEVVLRAGEETTLSCAVSSDRGFFTLDALDAATFGHVPGGRFELVDQSTGEVALSFEMGETPYQNPMAVPVGRYLLRQTSAAAGYALSEPHEAEVVVEPYLSEGGRVTSVQMTAARIPQDETLSIIDDVYTAAEQGLTLVCVDTGAVDAGEALHTPSLTIEVGAEGTERSDVASVVIAGAGDQQGGVYRARVEYCLSGGGWQPSDARMTQDLTGPTAVSLDDVHDDISAVRVTYLLNGEEITGAGFTPGHVTLSVQASAQGEVQMHASAAFDARFVYRTEPDGKRISMARRDEAEYAFSMQADSLFDTVSAGRDGRISGVAFFDDDADGVMDAAETGRYAGLTVSLQTPSGDEINTVRTAADGSYSFDSLSSGEYVVRFDAGESVVFSRGELYSAHAVSGVEDMRFGMSGVMQVDGDYTDFIVNVGCIFAAEVAGAVVENLAQGEVAGFSGLNVEMISVHAGEDEEPLVVVTGGMGDFAFSRVLPGTYRIMIDIPQGYLCRMSEQGRIEREITLGSGDVFAFDLLTLEKAAAVSGFVRVDEDGDGVIDGSARTLEGVRVALLESDGTHTQRIAETVTGADGAYAFDNLYPGSYSVLFELDGEWAFTRYGEDSHVYGAVSQRGATKTITLAPGETAQAINAGVTIPARLTVSAFEDTQYDGQKGVYEKMLSGVTVSLIRCENGEDGEAVTYITDETGSVVFDGVSPGEYVLAYRMPGQWRATRQVESSAYPVSCVPQSMLSEGRSEPFVLGMGLGQTHLYIGAMLSGSIAGMVYFDDDADAKRDENESACVQAQVHLLDKDGVTVAQTGVDDGGAYAFAGIAPGRYTVQFIAPQGCGFSGTERTATRGGVLESDDHVSSTRSIAVTAGQAFAGSDAGVVRLAAVGGVIWEDHIADQLQAQDERALCGVSVQLMDGAGRNILRTTQTGEQGEYVFDHLKPGTYKLRIDMPEGYVLSGPVQGGALAIETQRDGRGYTQSFALLGGANVQHAGFGLLTQGTISGVVWDDTDFDGAMAADEAGLRGVTVKLLDAHGTELASRQTIRSGEFAFDQLMPGEYALRVLLADGYQFTAAGVQSAAPQAGDSFADIPLGMLDMGGTISDVCIGALRSAAVGGIVWYDHNDDGRRENGDLGMEGVKVSLAMTGGADAGRVYETVTDAQGAYRFDGVMPGEAVLAFTLQDGYAFARQASGTKRISCVPMTDALEASTAPFAVHAGLSRTDLDVGVVGVGTVSGRVWADSAYDGRMSSGEEGVSGVQIQLVRADNGMTVSSVETDETGAFAIDFARMGEYLLDVSLPVGQIFTMSGDSAIAGEDTNAAQTQAFSLAMGESSDAFHIGAITPASIAGRVVLDANEDGVCDAQEAGLDGAVITAMQGGTVVATVRADENGSFAFETLRPGTYRLRYVLDENALFAYDVPLHLTDADAPEGETEEFSLSMGQQANVQPVGVIAAGRIAGCAFMDENVNGMQDDGEPALSGVTVELLDGSGTVIDTLQVGGDGGYAFERLRPGSYGVRFTLPQNVLFTEYAGESGGSCVPVVSGQTAESGWFSLAMGENRSGMHVGGILPGRIGDTVWHDKDGNGLQDYKEPLVPGVSLTLLAVGQDGAMHETATIQSDMYGYYAFDSLRPGTYVLRLNAEEGDMLTSVFGAPLGEIDSDLDPDTLLSAPIALKSGQTLRNIDVGLTDYVHD